MPNKVDLAMHERLVEEIYRISDNNSALSRKLGAKSDVVKNWIHQYIMPNAYYLAALYRQGADVIYILTGRRTVNDQTAS